MPAVAQTPGGLEPCQPLLRHAGVQTAVGLIDGDGGIHGFEHTRSGRKNCGKEIHERPGALDDYGRLRKRSPDAYHSASSVVNRKVRVLSIVYSLKGDAEFGSRQASQIGQTVNLDL